LHLIGIFGPTCSGKTSLAIEVAKKNNTEIISADSRQFFKELDIGVARPSLEELQSVPHHFIANKSIFKNYSAGDYEKEAIQLIQELSKNFNNLVVVGGSTLYIEALLYGIDELPDVPRELREDLKNQFEIKGLAWLREQISLRDSEYYNKVDLSNHRRMLRGLELMIHTGQKVSDLRIKNVKKRPFTFEAKWINLDRNYLYQRINSRCELMLQNGLLEEVKSVYPYKDLNALRTVGYSEFFDYLDGKTSFESAVELFKQHTRNYAKRQVTWFKAKKDWIII